MRNELKSSENKRKSALVRANKEQPNQNKKGEEKSSKMNRNCKGQ